MQRTQLPLSFLFDADALRAVFGYASARADEGASAQEVRLAKPRHKLCVDTTAGTPLGLCIPVEPAGALGWVCHADGETACTDWYIIFTGIAKGNTVLSASILPLNLIL